MRKTFSDISATLLEKPAFWKKTVLGSSSRTHKQNTEVYGSKFQNPETKRAI